jgi:hypothetical protein
VLPRTEPSLPQVVSNCFALVIGAHVDQARLNTLHLPLHREAIAMGILFSTLFSSLFGSREYRILILGLDNAGKTTILFRLQVCGAYLACGGISTSHIAIDMWHLRCCKLAFSPMSSTCSAQRPWLRIRPKQPKGTRIYVVQVDEPVTTVPTIGFNVETLQYKNIKFQVWDLGGQVRRASVCCT